MNDLTSQFTDVIAGLAAQPLDDDMTETVLLLLTDAVGCAAHGSTLPSIRILRETLLSLTGEGSHPVWGTNDLAAISTAVSLNATSIHAFELDDQCLGAGLHGAAAVVPVALALAEDHAASGQELLHAMAVGIEAGVRLGLMLGRVPSDHGFHTHAWTGAIAAAVTAGVILRSDSSMIADAIGIAGSITGGLGGAQYGADVKRFHAGRAAEAGLLGACLAANQFTGISDILGRDYGGILNSIASLPDAADRPTLITHPGFVFPQHLAIKLIPAKIGLQAPYAALNWVLSQHDVPVPQMIDRVRVYVPDHVAKRTQPLSKVRSMMGAQSSLEFIVAKRLLDGPVGPDSFSEAAIADDRLAAIASRIEIRPLNDAPGSSPESHGRVALTIAGQEYWSPADLAPSGFPGSLNRADLIDKFRTLSLPLLGVSRQGQVLDALAGLASATTNETRNLSRLLTP